MHYAVKAENVGMRKQVRIRCGCSSLPLGTGINIVPRICRSAWSRSWRSWKVHKVSRKTKLDRNREEQDPEESSLWSGEDKYDFSLPHHANQNTNWEDTTIVAERQLETKMVTKADEQGNSMSMKATVNLLDLRNMFLLHLAANWHMILNEADECCEKIGNVTEREPRIWETAGSYHTINSIPMCF